MRTRHRLPMMALPAICLAWMPISAASAASPSSVAKDNQAHPAALLLTGELIDVPAGSFEMGDSAGTGTDLPDGHYRVSAERPTHRVTLRAFRIGRTEVTKGQFAAFVAATGYRTEAERNAAGHVGCKVLDVMTRRADYQEGMSWHRLVVPQADNVPAGCISWNDAQVYVQWLSEKTGRHFRLPSEAEWEYAARAGSISTFPWGPDLNSACLYGNVADRTPWPEGSRGHWEHMPANCKDGHFWPSAVAQYRPNAWGIHDMIGNVWEWTQDCWNASYDGAPTDGAAWLTGDCTRRIFRGGSFDNGLPELRVPVRFSEDPGLRDLALGFRIAETP